MIVKKDLELLENSAAKLSITVSKDAVQEEYDKLLQKYTKSAHIKGFRPGKAPAAVLIQKYGEGLKAETTMAVMEEALKKAYEEIDQKPLGYDPPELEGDPVVELGSDFSFTVTFDIYPEIKLGNTGGLEIEVPVVTVADEDINRELEAIRDQNALVVEKADGKVEDGDIINVNYAEIGEDGGVIEGTSREDFVFTVGSKYNLYEFDSDVIGMAKDEEKIIEKTFPEDFTHSDLAGQTKKIKVKVNGIKMKDLPALDDELAQDVSDEYKTLADLKKAIRENLEKQVENRLESQKKDSLLDQIVAASEVPVPRSMAEAELDGQWQNFIMQSRLTEEQILGILQGQGKTKDDYLDEWRPSAEKNIKNYLVLNKLKEEEKIEVSPQEMDEEIRKQAEDSKMTFEEARDYLQKNGILEYLESDMKNKKLFEKLLAGSKIKKGNKISFLDFVGKKQ